LRKNQTQSLLDDEKKRGKIKKGSRRNSQDSIRFSSDALPKVHGKTSGPRNLHWEAEATLSQLSRGETTIGGAWGKEGGEKDIAISKEEGALQPKGRGTIRGQVGRAKPAPRKAMLP